MSSAAENSFILQLETHRLEGFKKLPKHILAAIGNPDDLSGSKVAIAKKFLKPINSHLDETSKAVDAMCIQHPIKGLRLLPISRFSDAHDVLTEARAKLERLVEEFIPVYPEAREDARRRLEPWGLFDELDYPVDPRRKFGLEWRTLTLAAPGELRVLNEQVYLEEQKKIQKDFEEARQVGVQMVAQEFQKLIDHMVERLTPQQLPDGTLERKTFRDSLVNNFHEFFKNFEGRDTILDHETLRSAVAEAKQVLTGISADTLRNLDTLSKHVKNKMQEIREVIDENVIDRPARKLVIRKRDSQQAA